MSMRLSRRRQAQREGSLLHARPENELLLRVAFTNHPRTNGRTSPKLLSISDASAARSPPYCLRPLQRRKKPFIVDYEIAQPKFVDGPKEACSLPALLPQLGLPDPAAKPAPGAATSPVELGPARSEIHMTLHLPPGTTTLVPIGTSVVRDYATFTSHTQQRAKTVTASRHITSAKPSPRRPCRRLQRLVRAVQKRPSPGLHSRPPTTPSTRHQACLLEAATSPPNPKP